MLPRLLDLPDLMERPIANVNTTFHSKEERLLAKQQAAHRLAAKREARPEACMFGSVKKLTTIYKRRVLVRKHATVKALKTTFTFELSNKQLMLTHVII
jgi:hypothetical protein